MVDVTGYTPVLEDLRLWEVYRDWVHTNPGTRFDGVIGDNETWQRLWHDLVVMPSRRYDALSGKFGQRFVEALVGELLGERGRMWNSERFVVFQMVILQQGQHVTTSQAI